MKAKIVFLVLSALILGACVSKNCQSGEECLIQAHILWDKREIQKAFKVYEKACELENIKACKILRNYYKEGTGTEVNLEKSQKYDQRSFEIYQKACELENIKACKDLAAEYEFGKKDKQKAKEYYQKSYEIAKKACEENNAWACYFLGGFYVTIETSEYILQYENENKGLKLSQILEKYKNKK